MRLIAKTKEQKKRIEELAEKYNYEIEFFVTLRGERIYKLTKTKEQTQIRSRL